MIPVLLTVLGWLGLGLIAVSFGEWIFHRHLMHRRNLLHRLSSSVQGIWHKHAVEHHGKYYHVFDHEPDAYGRHVNIELNWYQTVLYGIPAVILMSYLSWIGGIVIALLVILHHLAWNALHSEMHIPQGRWFSRTRPYRALLAYHQVHHDHTGSNFNVVVPFADFVMGTYRAS